jgi:hypothetical protein
MSTRKKPLGSEKNIGVSTNPSKGLLLEVEQTVDNFADMKRSKPAVGHEFRRLD